MTTVKAPTVIYIIAGEPSGDAIGARLMAAYRRTESNAVFVGVGGTLMERQGLRSLFDMRDISVMGFREIIGHIPLLRRRIAETLRHIRAVTPAMLVTIDSPGFNFRIAKALNDMPNMRKWHYVAPTVWAYKPQRVHKVKALYDGLLTVLPFEKPYFDKVGLPTYYVGHPVAETAPEITATCIAPQTFRTQYNITPDERVVAIMPGSRVGEIAAFGKILADSAAKLAKSHNLRVFYLTLPHLRGAVEEILHRAPYRYEILTTEEEKRACRMYADMCLVKSGTSTLEQIIYDSPALACYKVHPISAFLLRRMIRIPYASLPNILAQKEIMPEFLQENCTAEKIANCAADFLASPEKRAEQRRDMRGILASLRPESGRDPSDEAAYLLQTKNERQ